VFRIIFRIAIVSQKRRLPIGRHCGDVVCRAGLKGEQPQVSPRGLYRTGTEIKDSDCSLSWLYCPCGSWPLIQFPNLYTVGRTPWTGISPSQGRYLPRTHRTTQTHSDIHALNGFRTHDPSFRASEDSSCLRPRATEFGCIETVASLNSRKVNGNL
jgi:hypothetical protein